MNPITATTTGPPVGGNSSNRRGRETSAACEGGEALRVKGWPAENGGQLTQQKGLDISGG